MNGFKGVVFGIVLAVAGGVAIAADSVIGDVLKRYQAEGAGTFSAANGEKMWTQQFAASEEPMQRSCTSCHGTDLTKPGSHKRTGKVIEPLAPSVNGERFTDEAKIEKWFLRNCKWTLGRECTPQEKGDFLSYLGSK